MQKQGPPMALGPLMSKAGCSWMAPVEAAKKAVGMKMAPVAEEEEEEEPRRSELGVTAA